MRGFATFAIGSAMAVKDGQVRQVVDLWYGAGFGERPWADALQATADLIGGGAAAVLDVDRRDSQIGRIYVHELYNTDEYVTRMSLINPRKLYSLKLPKPHVFADYNVLSETEIDHSEFYDWIGRSHGLRYFIGARLDDGPRSLCASVEFTRRHGHVDKATAEMFQRVIPHIANAWRISEIVHELGDTRSLAELLVGQRLCGVVGLRRNGTILFMNAAAGKAVAARDGLMVMEGRLHAARSANDRTLQTAIARVLQPDLIELRGCGAVIAVPRPSGRTPFALRLVPCGLRGRHRGDPLPAALVMIANPDQSGLPSDATLRALGLSSAEARLAQQIVAGRTLPEAAAHLGIAHNTARAHLRSIFAKTQARSQVDLVRMLCEFARLDGAGLS
jgi:DNA-binding CsgD family transcriptional regulator